MLSALPIGCVEIAPSSYLEAVDFMSRMRNESKVNDLNAEIFVGLYGASAYEVLASQGFFEVGNN